MFLFIYFKRSANSDFIFATIGGPLYPRIVYICTKEAPDSIFSRASAPLEIPPTPIIGIFPIQMKVFFQYL